MTGFVSPSFSFGTTRSDESSFAFRSSPLVLRFLATHTATTTSRPMNTTPAHTMMAMNAPSSRPATMRLAVVSLSGSSDGGDGGVDGGAGVATASGSSAKRDRCGV